MAWTAKQTKLFDKLAADIPKGKLKDIRFVERLRTYDRARDPFAVIDLLEEIIGDEARRQALYKVLEDAEGVTTPEIVSQAVIEIMRRSDDAKKS